VIFANFTEQGGLIDNNIISEILIIPNPTSDLSTLQLHLLSHTNLHISVNNILGQELLVLYNTFTEDGMFSLELSLEEFSSGIYYINIKIGTENILEQIIKK